MLAVSIAGDALLYAGDYNITRDPQAYILDKFQVSRRDIQGWIHGPFYAQILDENPSECDFTRRFSPMNGSVAMDCGDSFKGW